jgi:hypothetical protein
MPLPAHPQRFWHKYFTFHYLTAVTTDPRLVATMVLQYDKSPDSILLDFGINPGQTFKSLISNNQFLFRVRSGSSQVSGVDIGSGKHSGKSLDFLQSERQNLNSTEMKDIIARHVETWNVSESPLLSATFNLNWAIWEANRRDYCHRCQAP